MPEVHDAVPAPRRRLAVRGGSLAAVLALGAAAALALGGGTPAGAAPAAGGVTVIHDQPYTKGPCDGRVQTQKLDAYLPQNAPAATPAVVFVHGGGFITGDKATPGIVAIATDLAERGWAVFSINYCLPQDGPGYPVEVDNTVAAVKYVAGHAGRFAIDPARLATWGGSAGANLALMAAVQLGTEHTTAPVAAAVGWSGPYNMLDFRGANPNIIATFTRYLGCDPRDPSCRATAAAASPITYVDGDTTPPMFLANSTEEVMPLTQMTGMADALRAAGVPYVALAVLGRAHSMALTDAAYCPSVDFLTAHLGPIGGGPCHPPAD